MKVKPIKVEKQMSWTPGQEFYYMFFRGDDGKSYRTCLSPSCGNFKRWRPIIDRIQSGLKDIWLDGIIVRGKNLIDADSMFTVVS